ncbi:MAG: RpiB/LacA/LacB family sugar-phosphate isomerase [bacterium]|nr:RpiB/LacA/LacB family sugar-phosphate isomerase [bacterium]
MIYLASDHAGFELKNKIRDYLLSKNLEVEDCGPESFNPGDDYPDLIYPAAEKVAQNPGSKGIIFGKSGEGEALVANKVDHIRAVVYYGGNPEVVKLSREHNDANVLSIGAGFVKEEEARKIVEEWLKQDFEGGRHQRRLEEIEKIEEKE